MNRFKISALALALASIATTSAMAQSSKANAWEGAYGQIGVGYGSFMPSIGGGTATTATPSPLPSYGYPATISQTTSASSVNNISTGLVNLALGYNWGINESYVLGLAATYYPGASSGATGVLNIAPTTINGGLGAKAVAGASTTASYNIKNLYSIVLTPGYTIDKDRLAYAKVGYTGATIGLSSPVLPYNSTNLTGFTLGIGYKQMVTSSVYAFGEVNYGMYGSQTISQTTTTGTAVTGMTVKGNGLDLLVGVGYRF